MHIPFYPLNQFIDHFFYYTGFEPEHSVDRLLPDGDVQLIFDFSDSPKFIYDNETLKEIQSCQNVWFAGFRTEPITIPSGKESEMLIVQFKKGKAFPFISEPMHNLTNYVIDADLVLKADIMNIREILLEAKTPEIKFWLLENILLKCYINQLEENPFVDFVISKIIESPNQISIGEIAQNTGYSQKHIIKLFKNSVGVTPKDFLKIIRFQKAVQQIDIQQSVDWSAISFDCGFYDQSHFIADFKLYSGFTPTEYTNLKGDFINYIPIK